MGKKILWNLPVWGLLDQSTIRREIMVAIFPGSMVLDSPPNFACLSQVPPFPLSTAITTSAKTADTGVVSLVFL